MVRVTRRGGIVGAQTRTLGRYAVAHLRTVSSPPASSNGVVERLTRAAERPAGPRVPAPRAGPACVRSWPDRGFQDTALHAGYDAAILFEHRAEKRREARHHRDPRGRMRWLDVDHPDGAWRAGRFVMTLNFYGARRSA